MKIRNGNLRGKRKVSDLRLLKSLNSIGENTLEEQIGDIERRSRIALGDLERLGPFLSIRSRVYPCGSYHFEPSMDISLEIRLVIRSAVLDMI